MDWFDLCSAHSAGASLQKSKKVIKMKPIKSSEKKSLFLIQILPWFVILATYLALGDGAVRVASKGRLLLRGSVVLPSLETAVHPLEV